MFNCMVQLLMNLPLRILFLPKWIIIITEIINPISCGHCVLYCISRESIQKVGIISFKMSLMCFFLEI